MCFLSYTSNAHVRPPTHTLHIHTHTWLHTSQEYAELQQWRCWYFFYQTTFFTDCIIQLINYTRNQLFARNFLYRIRLFCWKIALLLISNEYGHTSTFAFMFYQTTDVTVCLITHITHAAALTIMYAFTSHQTSLITVCLFTYILT